MEQKNKFILFLLIAVVIVIAVLASFGLNLFRGDTAEIALPTLTDPGSTAFPAATDQLTGNFVRVEVTPETVQDIIRTLDRPVSYQRSVKIERFYGENNTAAVSTANVQVDSGWTMVNYDQSVQPAGTEHTLVGEGVVYRWYGKNPRTWQHWQADERASETAQHLLRYEDVLDLEQERIGNTAYMDKEGLSCIYVEVPQDEFGYLEKYWISVTSGLLVCQETQKGERLVLRTSSYAMESPLASGTEFSLPDGTVLHQAGG